MRKKISFAGPSITQKEFDYVKDAVANGWYSTYDKHTKILEKTFAGYLGVKYSLATHCCTQALHLACAALGLTSEDEVIVTDFSWVATAYAVSYTGAQCVFVDIDPDTFCIDPDKIKEAITDKTKAIMMVHSYGYPARMDEIMAIAKEHGLKVIEDAAPALGAEYNGQKVGTFGDVACFSFQGAKMTVSGEGGMIVTDNPVLFKRIELLASMGRTDSQTMFWSDELGYQYTISNLTAALALAQVERVEELIELKRNIFSWYYDRLKDVSGIKLIVEKENCKSNYCYPSIVIEDSIKVPRDKIIASLKKTNIHCRPCFPRMSEFPLYKKDKRFETPVTELVEKKGISMPAAGNLNEEDIEFVCKSLIKIIGS
jgi:perosamine synthetase